MPDGDGAGPLAHPLLEDAAAIDCCRQAGFTSRERTCPLPGPAARTSLRPAFSAHRRARRTVASKSFFFAAAAEAESPDDWARAAQAQRIEGSWWPHWRGWIQMHSMIWPGR